MSSAEGWYSVDLSSMEPWILSGFGVKLHADSLPIFGKLTAYKHSVSFTAAVEDFFLGTPVDCSENTCTIFYDVFRVVPSPTP